MFQQLTKLAREADGRKPWQGGRAGASGRVWRAGASRQYSNYSWNEIPMGTILEAGATRKPDVEGTCLVAMKTN